MAKWSTFQGFGHPFWPKLLASFSLQLFLFPCDYKFTNLAVLVLLLYSIIILSQKSAVLQDFSVHQCLWLSSLFADTPNGQASIVLTFMNLSSSFNNQPAFLIALETSPCPWQISHLSLFCLYDELFSVLCSSGHNHVSVHCPMCQIRPLILGTDEWGIATLPIGRVRQLTYSNS